LPADCLANSRRNVARIRVKALAMSEQPPFPSEPERRDPDPSWPPPTPGYGYGYEQQQYPPAAPYSYAPPGPYIPPGVTLSSWGRRFAAYLIDGIMQSVLALGVAVGIGFAVYNAVSGSDAENAGWAAGVIAYIVLALVWFVLYPPLTMRRQGERNGQTWGKQWLGIRVIREDGQPVTAGTGFIRDVLMQDLVFGFIGSFVFYVPWLLDGLWPLWDDRNQALHDKVASTFVIDCSA
jgi:uncharacterized RDD family membrane protein YckC